MESPVGRYPATNRGFCLFIEKVIIAVTNVGQSKRSIQMFCVNLHMNPRW